MRQLIDIKSMKGEGPVGDQIMMAVLALIAVASATDLVDDLAHGADRLHLVLEGGVLLAALALLAWLLNARRVDARERARLVEELSLARRRAAAGDQAARDARRQLGEFVNAQFVAWGLTESEREIGWLLLKGLSLKEIAALRATAERTVRTQASALYQKAGLDGRHAFAAWFLEDLL